MNKINFTAQDKFPLSTQVMGFLQEMVKLNANFSALGGDNYILYGCVADGSGNVSEGVVVIAGEILPFAGWDSASGVIPEKVMIEQTFTTLHAFGVDYPEAQITRIAKFSATGEYNWTDIQRVESHLQITKRLNELATIPKGLIALWSGDVNNIPAGWALCDGLNGTPNLSGRFIVGFNQQDEDYSDIGKTGGQAKIKLLAENMPAHKHTTTFKKAGVDDTQDPNYNALVSDDSAGAYVDKESQPAGEGLEHENRPPYYVLAYIIKL